MRLYFIGTGAGGSPGSRRWRTSVLLESGGSYLLVDCGVGCHYRLSDKGLLRDLDAVFITHPHMDHFLGLPELLFQAHMDGRRKELLIIGPPGLEDFIRISGPHLFTALSFTFSVKVVKPKRKTLIGGVELTPHEACHRISNAYGLRVSTTDGLEVGFSGDTAEPCSTLIQGLKGVGVLIHEATCDKEHCEVCQQYGHSTNWEATSAAESVGASSLILYHIDEVFNAGLREEAEDIRARSEFKLYIPNDGEYLTFT